MGLCFSKKKPPATPAGGAKKPGKIADDQAKKTAQQPKRAAKAAAAAGEPAASGKAAVLVVRGKDAAEGGGERKKRPGSQEAAAAEKPLPVVVVPSAPVRTSSCTKEEVDAILIQCGRLSRSSSGTGRAASSEAASGHRRRRSGSKRSYDFDQDARSGGGAGADEDWERQGAAAVSRPSPHRGSPQRKRSGSRERSSGGGGSGSRRASRSPGRRTDGAAASAATAGSSGGGERARQQPGKMVSVPAREKGRAPSPAAASGKRCASPRSSSPARMVPANENAGCGPVVGPTPALSRSSSRKAEQSPYRRNPMAELDENSLRNNSNHSAKPQKKSIENAVAATPKKKAMERGKEPTVAASCRSGMEKPEIAEEGATIAAASETRAPSSKTNATRTASIVAVGQPGSSRSRRASRDFDQNSGSYTTQLLEDIQNYHQQSTSIAVPATPATPSFSLPACVAKACSIVEAVADLNSSSSENCTHEYEPVLSADDKGSVNAPLGSDGSVEPSAARKPVQPVRDFRVETEPQESAGSNSVSGHQWTPSWEPPSVESTDRTWSTGDEVVEQSGSHGARCSPMNRPRQSKQRPSQPETSGRGSRAGSGNVGNTLHRGRSAHRGSTSSVASGRSGVRVVSAAS
ncbi:hypothetical protein GQ55_1G314700 [Panicum hallii var. hallii]|uniref:Uncharacterized protein n=1 Tax=Panicum hallii var. hallii TaxID=1504633 RepID=A0A2T7F9I6_9POAL|nr:hypothetical protein GQ55_1G314700 [Panicum hallii var. hallii]